ncbi:MULTISPECIES: precorrin-6A reductase [Anaerotruncus]|nr:MULTISPECIES: precorrin-6A reductase [Anaerotruncus]MCI8491860.1 precorrin-6A reductase [Anaerotruncus sp.]MCR2025810.1 precorrin-6A reductase [Anaerotruncus colihominis]
MANFLVFAGTSEGRRLVEYLNACGASVCASVATEYGKMLLPEGVEVLSKRLDTSDIAALLKSLQFDCVIDATHPYAVLATDHIHAACEETGMPYLRLIRPSNMPDDGCVFVEDAAQAAEVLAAATGKVLLTTGVKELDAFVHLTDYQERIYPRVLPSVESIQRCLALGYRIQNIIAMQGPFTRELNSAVMRQIGASIVVTKESGGAGGFAEKLGAARDAGAIAVVIGRPRTEVGLTYDELVERLARDFSLQPRMAAEGSETAVRRFPLFVDLTNSKIVLFGGGAAAAARAAALLPYCGSLTVISAHPSPELEALGVPILRRSYMQGDCTGYMMVSAATGTLEIDRAICKEAYRAGIPAECAAAPSEGTFCIPTVLDSPLLTIGIYGDKAAEEQMTSGVRALLNQEQKPLD